MSLKVRRCEDAHRLFLQFKFYKDIIKIFANNNSTASIAQFESKKELTETYKELYQTKKRECNVRAKLGFK